MSKRAIEKAYDAYPLNESNRYNNEWNAKRVGYQKGYEQALSDVKNLIDSNLAPGYAGKIIRLIEQNYE